MKKESRLIQWTYITGLWSLQHRDRLHHWVTMQSSATSVALCLLAGTVAALQSSQTGESAGHVVWWHYTELCKSERGSRRMNRRSRCQQDLPKKRKDAMKPISEYVCLNNCTVPSVFLDKQQASTLISRQKRNAGSSTLEQACMEKVCTYEEARKFFQDSYRTVSTLFSPSSRLSFFKTWPLIMRNFFSRICFGQSTSVSAALKTAS